MSLSRICDVCHQTITGQVYVELGARVLDPAEGVEQSELEAAHGDYCAMCLADGSALKDLVRALQHPLKMLKTLLGIEQKKKGKA